MRSRVVFTIALMVWCAHSSSLNTSSANPAVQPQRLPPGPFGRDCRARLPSMFPKSTPASCDCLEEMFGAEFRAQEGSLDLSTVSGEQFEELFLMASVSKVGLHKKVAACLR